MSHKYLLAVVPAASRDQCDALVAPYLTEAAAGTEFSAPMVPAGGPADAAPTHFGCCAGGLEATAAVVAAAPAMAMGVPGSACRVVDMDAFDYEQDWHGWLASLGLQVTRLTE